MFEDFKIIKAEVVIQVSPHKRKTTCKLKKDPEITKEEYYLGLYELMDEIKKELKKWVKN